MLKRVEQVNQVKTRLLLGPVIHRGLTSERVEAKLIAQELAGSRDMLWRQQHTDLVAEFAHLCAKALCQCSDSNGEMFIHRHFSLR